MSRNDSERQILRSTTIFGFSTILSMALGLVRSKIVALYLGPTGIGQIGLFNSFLVTSTSLGSLGMGISGVRRVAEVRDSGEAPTLSSVRRSLMAGLIALGVVAALAIWLFRMPLARFLTGDAAQGDTIALLGIGTAFGVAAVAQNALLSGLRRIGDIARTSLLAAAATTVIGLALILLLGDKAIVPYVILTPIVTFAVGHYYVARVGIGPAPAGQRVADDLRACRGLIRLGLASLTTLFLMSGGLLVLRAQINNLVGASALGYYEASWTLLNAYLGAVLVAMGSDFYPRLVAALKIPGEATALVNEQTRLALLIAGPMCIVIIAFAPVILQLLFSSEFVPAATVLRTMIIGDIFKLISWPLGFVLIASQDSKRMIAGEVMMVGALLLIGWVGLGTLGVVAAGIGYCTMYVLYAVVGRYWLGSKIGFSWDRSVIHHAVRLIIFAGSTFAVSAYSEPLAMALGAVFAIILTVFAVGEIDIILGGQGRIGRIVATLHRWTGKEATRG